MSETGHLFEWRSAASGEFDHPPPKGNKKAAKPRTCMVCSKEFQPALKPSGKPRSTKTCSEECKRAVLSQVSSQFESMLGRVFGWWTVVAHVVARTCAVRCRCGFETVLPTYALRFGSSSASCRSCAPKKRLDEMTRERREEVEAWRRASSKRNVFGAHRKMTADERAALDSKAAKEWRLRGREARKQLLNSYKRFPCQDCGGMFPPVCMDFDHRPGETKSDGLSKLVIKAASFETILDEMNKCDLVCSNCHRIRTHRRMLEETGRQDTNGSLIVEWNHEDIPLR